MKGWLVVFFSPMMSPLFILGPCVLESLEQVVPIVKLAKKYGVSYFRAHLFKPRTSPDSFQGLGEEGLFLLEFLKGEGMGLVCEAASLAQLDFLLPHASIIQIGARNMQNFELLKAIGQKLGQHKVILKRGFANNMHEWLSSAKYLQRSGVLPENIILCERGTRNWPAPHGVTLDLALAWKVKEDTGYQVIIDPSHGTRESSLVLPLARAALALNFAGLMIETHPFPAKSLSDPQQAVSLESLDQFLSEFSQTGPF